MTYSHTLQSTARALVADGKGILAADESFPTISRRFAALGIPFDEPTRRAWRELLFTTSGLSEYISGGILFDETLNQKTSDGTPFAEALSERGIIPGIKVDLGTRALPLFRGELITGGLDGLRARLVTYRELGARFTKWRAVINIGGNRPSLTAVASNTRMLALFAAVSQEAGLVPIVEPEVLMEGDHDIRRCEEVSCLTLESMFAHLAEHRVALDGMLLKTSMVLPGEDGPAVSSKDIAAATLRCLRQNVPPEVAGIVFLSGGQSEAEAAEHLETICLGDKSQWPLSFSFGRALQNSAMKIWHGDSANTAGAQAALLEHARLNAYAIRRHSPAAV